MNLQRFLHNTVTELLILVLTALGCTGLQASVNIWKAFNVNVTVLLEGTYFEVAMQNEIFCALLAAKRDGALYCHNGVRCIVATEGVEGVATTEWHCKNNGLFPGNKKQGDGLYYILLQSDNVTQAEARQRCASLPGYRLAQAKSVQTMELMKNMWYSNEEKLWRDDLRCGAMFPLLAPFEGRPAECDPWSASKCCSNYNHCGGTSEFCACPVCKDFSEGMPRVNSGDFWIDLSKDPIGGGGAAGAVQWVWGDGTVLDQALVTSNEPVVNGDGSTGALIARYKVHEAASDAMHGYLCQANYDDVSW